ncbi:MAG: hypothetical protein U5R31_06290 [Acidimicrobiia bacterium]|nr:hypothetical protein [Acidimicrobiia bacterium]
MVPPGRRSATAVFPAAIVAPVLSAGEPTNFDIAALHAERRVTSDDVELTVEFGSELRVPPDDYRLSVVLGEPAAGQQVVTLVRTRTATWSADSTGGPPGRLNTVGPLQVNVGPDERQRAGSGRAEEGYVWATAAEGAPPITFGAPSSPAAGVPRRGQARGPRHRRRRVVARTVGERRWSRRSSPRDPSGGRRPGHAALSAPLPDEVAGAAPRCGRGRSASSASRPTTASRGQAPTSFTVDYAAGVVKLLDAPGRSR